MSQFPNQPQGQWPNQQGGGPSPFDPQPQKSSSAGKILLIIGILVVVPIVLCCVGGIGFLAYVGTVSPETFVVSGSQLESRHRQELESLGLIEPGEKILLIYSDGLFSVKEGVYFLTEENLVLHSDSWADTTAVIPYQMIDDVYVYEDDLGWDMIFQVYTKDEEQWSFPISTENGGDESFYDLLVEKVPDLE